MTRPHAPKIAIICDWLTNMGGAEKVVLALHETFPNAPIYTSVFDANTMPAFRNLNIRTTYLQRFPKFVRNLHKFMPMLRVHAFRSLDLSEYDIIISSASAEAKQIKKTRPDQIHICYCHTPIRYYWSHYGEYRANPGFGKFNWLIRLTMPLFVPRLKKADLRAAQEVDFFIANSSAVKYRIEKYYKRPANVIYPPVDTQRFVPSQKRGDYYVALSRHAPYKRLDLAIAAANELRVPLRIFGSGSETSKLRLMAGPTITFHEGSPSKKDQAEITRSLTHGRGYLFPAEEDFGITPVEAMAGGSPVIAFGKGGALDIVDDGKTGVIFSQQTLESVVDAIKRAEKIHFSPTTLHTQAERFDQTHFTIKMKNFVEKSYSLKR